MSFKKRIEANRRNAQKATTQGLSSLNYNPLAPGYFLLTEAVYSKWKQQRLLALRNRPSRSHHRPEQARFPQNLYLRYDAQLHRHYRNCLKDLRDLEDRRAIQPEPKPETPIEPKPPTPETEIPTPEPQKTEVPIEPKPTLEELRLQAARAKIRRLMEINQRPAACWPHWSGPHLLVTPSYARVPGRPVGVS